MRFLRSTCAAALLFSFAAAPMADAAPTRYRGQIALSGYLQDEAQPGSISFTFRGQLRDAQGLRANVTGGGLFRTPSSNLANAVFTGRLVTLSRTAARTGVPSRLIRRTKVVRIRVKGRSLSFPGARIGLTKAVDGRMDERQNIRGRGIYQVNL